MYKASSSGSGPQGPGAGGEAPGADGAKPSEEKPKDNVVDAEFVDVDDKK
jgi:molecular chaperone DnaK